MFRTFSKKPIVPLNVPMPTLGGKQLWTDRQVKMGWRIQTNELTGHSRLLDGRDVRRAWGDIAACQKALSTFCGGEQKPGDPDHLVVLLHGLGRSKDAFSTLTNAVDAAGYDVLALNYPSLLDGVSAHAERVNTVLDAMSGYRKVTFVTHSLGSLIVRTLLSGSCAWRSRMDVKGVVVIAPPNQGSALAEQLSRFGLFRQLAGPSGIDATIKHKSGIAPLDVPYLIVAGSNRRGKGLNPFLDGDDDGVVKVEETLLSDHDAFLKVEDCHTYISQNEQTVRAVIRFLED